MSHGKIRISLSGVMLVCRGALCHLCYSHLGREHGANLRSPPKEVVGTRKNLNAQRIVSFCLRFA